MKKYLIILFWLVCVSLSATNYYIKTGGNDANTGLSDAQAWLTVTKVNTVWAAGTFAPGDNIYFNRGNTFTGTITVSESGSAGNPITIGAYGTGADPIINGFTTLTGWTNVGSGVYSKVVTCASATVIVTFDGVNTQMGKFPDAVCMFPDSYSGTTQITDTHLGGENWTGAEVVIRNNLYVWNHIPITSQSGNTITFSSGTQYAVTSYGYFIQNDLRTLTAYKEWYYNSATSTFYMYFGAEVPTDHVVRVAAVNNGVNDSGYGYITFDNITFEGFNARAFSLANCPHLTIQNCTIRFCGINGVDDQGSADTDHASTGFLFNNNVVNDIGCNGVQLRSQFTSLTISNNTFTNIGVVRGQGYSKPPDIANNAFCALMIGKHQHDNIASVIEYNTITNVGYDGIYFYGGHMTVRYNVIDYCLMTLDDGGGIYTYDASYLARTSTITYNIVLHAMGDGTTKSNPTYVYPYGIYCDGSTSGALITHNTVAYSSDAGYFQNGNTNGSLEDNTFYDNKESVHLNNMSGMSIQRNIFFARTASQKTAVYDFLGAPTASNTLNYNFYTRPISEGSSMAHPAATAMALATWKTATGDDVSSLTSPHTVTSDAQIHFIYNTTTSNQTYTVSAQMYSADNIGYNGFLILAPFTSKILLGTGTVTPYTAPEALVVLTISVNAGNHQATIGFNITDDGGAAVTDRGVCWSTSANPTVSSLHTHDGSGTGAFNSYITNLSGSTTYHARGYAVNSFGPGYSADIVFTTTPDNIIPTLTTAAISVIAETTATSGGEVLTVGSADVTARGVCWNTVTNPTTANSKTTNGTGIGSFVSNLTSLTANTTYYVRAYATSTAGTGYGNQQIFVTLSAPDYPEVTTASIGSITSITAVGGGNVTDDGGEAVTARGICWSTSQFPTTADSKTTNGSGTGTFTSNLTGLTDTFVYYVRAYATNSVGTAYGGQISFTAVDPTPPTGLQGDYLFFNGEIIMLGNKVIVNE